MENELKKLLKALNKTVDALNEYCKTLKELTEELKLSKEIEIQKAYAKSFKETINLIKGGKK